MYIFLSLTAPLQFFNISSKPQYQNHQSSNINHLLTTKTFQDPSTELIIINMSNSSNSHYPMAGLVSNINVGTDNVDTDVKTASNNESLSELSPVERKPTSLKYSQVTS